jgi:ParB family chromosome partitioning protein
VNDRLVIKRVPIHSLTPDAANVRKHDAANLRALAGSLRRFGQQKPIVIDRNGVVRAGNGTLDAAKSLGWTHISVIQSELPISELIAYAITDNRIPELASWDKPALLTLLAEPEIGDVGFTDQEIQRLLKDKSMRTEDLAQRIDATFEVIVACRDEAHQRELFERLTGEGLQCKALTL